MSELAEKMGVSQAYLVQIETGQVQPTLEQIEVIQSFIKGVCRWNFHLKS